jgi:hypothetical protein
MDAAPWSLRGEDSPLQLCDRAQGFLVFCINQRSGPSSGLFLNEGIFVRIRVII